jgi:hypothetical protein
MSLSGDQRVLLDEWLGDWRQLDDLSWPLQDTTVLHVLSPRHGEAIVKATTTNHHLRREIWAHSGHLGHMSGLVPRMLYSDVDAGVMVATYLPGTLVLGTDEDHSPVTYREAGELLSKFMTPLGPSEEYLRINRAKALALVEKATGLAEAAQLELARALLVKIEPGPVELVLTHGDFQPRNWLRGDAGQLLLIDFGRAAPRHWTSELPRLESRAFDVPGVREAFFGGLGFEPNDEDIVPLRLERLGMALGTIVWAREVGDATFEDEDRAMLERAVAEAGAD